MWVIRCSREPQTINACPSLSLSLSLSVLPSVWTLCFLCRRNPKMKWNLAFVWSLWVGSSWSSLWGVEFSMLSLGKFSPENCWKTVFTLVLHRKSLSLIIPSLRGSYFQGFPCEKKHWRICNAWLPATFMIISSLWTCMCCCWIQISLLWFSLWCNLPWGREAHLLLAKWSRRDK